MYVPDYGIIEENKVDTELSKKLWLIDKLHLQIIHNNMNHWMVNINVNNAKGH